MGAEVLSSRAVIGTFYELLEQNVGNSWIDAVSNLFDSDQAKETYPWIGMVPTLREWIGGRHAKGFNSAELEIENLHFEATIEVLVKELRRDKTGQLRIRLGELADRTNAHWARLLSVLLLNGESQVCYDGQYYFDTDHQEGQSGVQSNKITTTIANLVAENPGTPSAPSVAVFQQAVARWPGVKLAKNQATYLAWIDFAGTGMSTSEFTARVEKQALIAANADLAHQLEDLHELVGTGFYWVVGLHVMATLYHHLVRRDDTLRRMT